MGAVVEGGGGHGRSCFGKPQPRLRLPPRVGWVELLLLYLSHVSTTFTFFSGWEYAQGQERIE